MDKNLKAPAVYKTALPYEFIIGPGASARLLENEKFKSADKRAFLVSEKVYGLHRERIDSLRAGSELFLYTDSEANKNYLEAGNYINRFIECGLTRNSVLVAAGGGVTGDFAGFVAAVYMRGIPLIHLPTTLLAMVDSSIGGKVAVNTGKGKNIAGAFHRPSSVYIDTVFLKTLPVPEMRNGLTEILKHSFIGEKESFNIIDSIPAERVMDEEIIEKLIKLSVSFKSTVVAEDEKESGLRAILNFGHTAGHSLESSGSYSSIAHGRAVAYGMKIAADLSMHSGLLSPADNSRIHDLINKFSLTGSGIEFNAAELIRHMSYDKKNRGDVINFVLLKGLFKPLINQTIRPELLMKVIEQYSSGS